MTYEDLELIKDRMTAYEKAWSSKDGNFDAVLDLFADNVDFSDYAMGALHLDKEGATGYFATMGSIATDFKATTRCLGGSEAPAVWEIDFEMTMLADVPGVPYAKGERAKMQGCCVVTWGGEKIVRQADYFCWVKPEEKKL